MFTGICADVGHALLWDLYYFLFMLSAQNFNTFLRHFPVFLLIFRNYGIRKVQFLSFSCRTAAVIQYHLL